MTLHLGRSFEDGIRRVFTLTGGILLVILLLLQLLVQSTVNTLVLGFVPPETREIVGMFGLTLPVSTPIAGALFVVTLIGSSAYIVVVTRALTRPHNELSSFPSDLYSRRMVRSTLTTLIGGIITFVLITIGFAFLLLPGIFLAICFLFFIFAVGVEDRGVISGLKRSWGLSRGNRFRLFVIVLLAGVIGMLIGLVGGLFDLTESPLAGELVSIVIGSVLFIVLYGIMAAAYVQVQNT